jgi:hypothetical protein
MELKSATLPPIESGETSPLPAAQGWYSRWLFRHAGQRSCDQSVNLFRDSFARSFSTSWRCATDHTHIKGAIQVYPIACVCSELAA